MSNLDDLLKNLKEGDLVEFEVEDFGKFASFYYGVEEKEREEESENIVAGMIYLPIGELTDGFDEKYGQFRIGRLESQTQLLFNQYHPKGVDLPGEYHTEMELPDVYVTSTEEGHFIAGRKITSGRMLDPKKFVSDGLFPYDKENFIQLKFLGNEENFIVAYSVAEFLEGLLSPFSNKIILPWIVEENSDDQIKLTVPDAHFFCKSNNVETGDQVWTGLVTELRQYPVDEVRKYNSS